jgi:hypothetical protein
MRFGAFGEENYRVYSCFEALSKKKKMPLFLKKKKKLRIK